MRTIIRIPFSTCLVPHRACGASACPAVRVAAGRRTTWWSRPSMQLNRSPTGVHQTPLGQPLVWLEGPRWTTHARLQGALAQRIPTRREPLLGFALRAASSTPPGHAANDRPPRCRPPQRREHTRIRGERSFRWGGRLALARDRAPWRTVPRSVWPVGTKSAHPYRPDIHPQRGANNPKLGKAPHG